jgi:hypothetical protein
MGRDQLRALFNTLYLQRYKDGDFIETVVEWNYPHPRSCQDRETRSQRVRLTDPETQRVVAIVHRFRHYSGETRASGDPDPKRVWANGVWYWETGEFRRQRGRGER